MTCAQLNQRAPLRKIGLAVGSVVNGPLRTLRDVYFMHKGVMDEPMRILLIPLSTLLCHTRFDEYS